MGTRYNNKRIIVNDDDIYKEFREARNTKQIRQYETPDIPYLSIGHRLSLDRLQHIWSHGDKYWKLSSQYYNTPSYWWLIAWFNQKPTEAHVKIGDVIIIPKPLSKILKYYQTIR